MGFSVIKQMNDRGEDAFYEDGWLRTVEANLPILVRRGTTTKAVDEIDAYKFEGDFYGYLASINVPQCYFYVYLRLNNMYNPHDWARKELAYQEGQYKTTLIVPDSSVIEQLMKRYMTVRL